MAKKGSKGAGSKRKPNDYGGYTFYNVGLSSDDKAWLADADRAVEFPLTEIISMVSEGYKFSLREDEKNNTFVASLTDLRSESPNNKVILSGRGSTAINAWHALAYRHMVLLVDGWGDVEAAEGVSDFD